MNARLLSSVIWVILLIVPPLRLLVEGLSVLLWPSIEPFTTLAELHPRWVPFVVIVVLGYVVTYGICAFILKELRKASPLFSQADGGPTLKTPAVVVTASWVILAAVLGALTVPLFLIALLVPVAFVGLPEASPVVPPEPLPLPVPPAPLPEVTLEHEMPEGMTEDTEDETYYYRFFTWLFNEEPYRKSGQTHRFELQVPIPKDIYEDLMSRDHTVTSDADYVEFANVQLDDETISYVAKQLRNLAVQNGFDELAEIHLAMAYTLCMPYAFDDLEYGRNYPKFPVEMLVDKRGDCEDFSILCGVLLHRLGHRVALLLMDFSHLDHGHAALGVVPPMPIEGDAIYSREMEAELFYCEVTPALGATTETTTNGQWWLGMSIPERIQDLKVYPIGSA